MGQKLVKQGKEALEKSRLELYANSQGSAESEPIHTLAACCAYFRNKIKIVL